MSDSVEGKEGAADVEADSMQSAASDSSPDQKHPFVDLRFALIGGVVAAGVIFLAISLVGSTSVGEASRLLNSIRSTLQFFASGVIAAGSTILALMLTLLGITYTTEFSFSHIHFKRVVQISVLTTSMIIVAVSMLMVLMLPVSESDGFRVYNNIVYYILLGFGAVLGGLMVSIVLMLHRTVAALARIGHPGSDSDILDDAQGA